MIRISATAASIVIFVAANTHGAHADDEASLPKVTTNYAAAQKSITATFDSDIEVITPELQKIQFASSGQLRMIDQLVDAIQTKTGAAMPRTDLLLSNSFVLTSDVIEGHHVGQGVVDGVECEHLAFRGTDTDWQTSIQTGAQPIPREHVMAGKTIAGAPQHTLRIKDWKTDAIADADFVCPLTPE